MLYLQRSKSPSIRTVPNHTEHQSNDPSSIVVKRSRKFHNTNGVPVAVAVTELETSVSDIDPRRLLRTERLPHELHIQLGTVAHAALCSRSTLYWSDDLI
jgi:hypothetical protein